MSQHERAIGPERRRRTTRSVWAAALGRRTTRRAWSAALVVATLGALFLGVATARAAVLFTGGADICPMFVPDDHTPVAIHFAATGDELAPNATYYAKVRLNTSTTPSPTGNRGWIWNQSSGQWVQERDDWTKFPTVTTDGSGHIAGWLVAKFGDESLSGAYFVIISLTPTPYANGQVLNSSICPPVTVLDMATTGAWVHNGVSTGASAAASVEVVATPSSAGGLARGLTEPSGVDGNGDGVTGAENYGYGPTSTGDIRVAVPLAQDFDVLLDGAPWTPGAGITVTQPDVDLALGAADQTPPTAPAGLTATAGHDEVDLHWTAATDPDNDAAQLLYDVFRWTDPTPIGGATSYSSPRLLIGATAEGTTSFADTTAVDGTSYHYLVRAVDPATNVGPRSLTVTATPEPTVASLTTSTAVVGFGKSAKLTGSLSVGATLLLDQAAVLEWSADGSAHWTTAETLTPATAGRYVVTVKPRNAVKTWYRLDYRGLAPYGAALSAAVAVTPQVQLTAPTVPRSIEAGRAFAAVGYLHPRKAAGMHVARIRCYRLVKRAWVLKKTVWATAQNYGGATRYRAVVDLTAAGRWRLRATFAGDAANAATVGPYRYLTAR